MFSFLSTKAEAATKYIPLTDIGDFSKSLINKAESGLPTNLTDLINFAFYVMLTVAVVLAIFGVIRGGYVYLTSADSGSNKSRAKRILQASVGGLLLALGGWLILDTINPQILKFDPKYQELERPEIAKIQTEYLQNNMNYSQTRLSGNIATGEEFGLRNTHYYVADAQNYSGVKNVPIYDKNGNIIAYETSGFREALRIEGTGRLSDGRIINVGRNNSEYFVTDSPWGLGVENRKLEPFVSVAVDRSSIPIGSKLYIRETDGMVLPDGSKHNGIWRADDIGSAIKGDRVDLFVGNKVGGNTLTKNGISNMQNLTVKIIE
jgi:3D (Asp-Asp-Asp) domain-containing protein